MNTPTKFDLNQTDFEQLKLYLQDSPHDICKGISEVVMQECADILDIFSEVRIHLSRPTQGIVSFVFVRKVFEKALLMILNRPVNVSDPAIIEAGVNALWNAYDDLEASNADDIEDEVREAITDWDNGMIACAIIKSCGNAAMLQPA